MQRRQFIQAIAASTAAAALGTLVPMSNAQSTATTSPSSNRALLPRRKYGKTGIELSIIGFGGIIVGDMEQDHANRVVADAIEMGVNYFDVAPSYGQAEAKLGPALEPFRKNVFLACKTTQRDAQKAAVEFHTSLERMRTDWFDLYQLHSITDVAKDVDAAFAKGGTMELLIERRKAGQIRHLGFSAHSAEAALAAMERYDFDSVLFPINFSNFYKGHFGPQIMARAQAKGVARLALKMLARQQWPKDDPLRQQYKMWYQPVTDPQEQELAARFTLSQPITAAIPPGNESLFRRAVELAMRFRPITEAETAQLKTIAEGTKPLFSSSI